MSPEHSFWKQLQSAVCNNRTPQALLFVGPPHAGIDQHILQLIQLILCQNENKPCKECLDCRMAVSIEHPDIVWIKPEKSTSAIKIDQIRALQESAYLTPQRTKHRVIVIEGADRMNTASANALLKILEEPAPHSVFILLAQQVSTILPTVISRCQLHRFNTTEDSFKTLAEYYAPESEQGLLFQQTTPILNGLIDVIKGKLHPSTLAAQWSQHELSHLFWFLYLVFAQIQYLKINENQQITLNQQEFNTLGNLLNPLKIFNQIDKINTILRKLSHNMNINTTLALEDFLFSLVTKS